MRISDWSSDVCSSDLKRPVATMANADRFPDGSCPWPDRLCRRPGRPLRADDYPLCDLAPRPDIPASPLHSGASAPFLLLGYLYFLHGSAPRQRVVLVTIVSVRVYLGCLLFFIKK